METIQSVVEKFEGWDLDISSTGTVTARFANDHMATLFVTDIISLWPEGRYSYGNR
jgi:hypothetical protein